MKKLYSVIIVIGLIITSGCSQLTPTFLLQKDLPDGYEIKSYNNYAIPNKMPFSLDLTHGLSESDKYEGDVPKGKRYFQTIIDIEKKNVNIHTTMEIRISKIDSNYKHATDDLIGEWGDAREREIISVGDKSTLLTSNNKNFTHALLVFRHGDYLVFIQGLESIENSAYKNSDIRFETLQIAEIIDNNIKEYN